MPFISALISPFFFVPRHSFSYWNGGKAQLLGMVALSFLCDAGLQRHLGILTLPGLAMAVGGALVFLLLPHRLACAAATLAIVQVLPGLWAYGAIYAQVESEWAEVPGLILRFWGLAAFAWLILSYLRTPKSEWRAPARPSQP